MDTHNTAMPPGKVVPNESIGRWRCRAQTVAGPTPIPPLMPSTSPTRRYRTPPPHNRARARSGAAVQATLSSRSATMHPAASVR
jgi:hypothetical protein